MALFETTAADPAYALSREQPPHDVDEDTASRSKDAAVAAA
jgi:hypothetical protein